MRAVYTRGMTVRAAPVTHSSGPKNILFKEGTFVLFPIAYNSVNLLLNAPFPEIARMKTTEVYEKTYRDAREVLFLRGKRVGGPAFGDDGLRYCPVDGFSCTDREILREAWGDSLADEILGELEQHKALPNHCP